MKEQEIKEGNELIARFMDLTENNNGLSYFVETQGWTSPLNLLYDTSWDWLMPVVEKIKDIRDDSNFDKYKKPRIFYQSIFATIDNVYKAVVEFIKWYNNQKQLI